MAVVGKMKVSPRSSSFGHLDGHFVNVELGRNYEVITKFLKKFLAFLIGDHFG